MPAILEGAVAKTALGTVREENRARPQAGSGLIIWHVAVTRWCAAPVTGQGRARQVLSPCCAAAQELTTPVSSIECEVSESFRYIEQEAVSITGTIGRVEATRAKRALPDYIDSWTLAGSDEAQSETQPVGQMYMCGASSTGDLFGDKSGDGRRVIWKRTSQPCSPKPSKT